MGAGHTCQALDGWKQPEGFDSPILRATVQLVLANGTLGPLAPTPCRRNLRLLGKRALYLWHCEYQAPHRGAFPFACKRTSRGAFTGSPW